MVDPDKTIALAGLVKYQGASRRHRSPSLLHARRSFCLRRRSDGRDTRASRRQLARPASDQAGTQEKLKAS
jgi:hypothetical protein